MEHEQPLLGEQPPLLSRAQRVPPEGLLCKQGSNRFTTAPQVGCAKGGAWYEDYAYIGGQHRYAVDQYGGGRGDPHARASARLWYTANVAAAGLPMVFMGTEFAQSGWWCAGQLTWPPVSYMAFIACRGALLRLRKPVHAASAIHGPARRRRAPV